MSKRWGQAVGLGLVMLALTGCVGYAQIDEGHAGVFVVWGVADPKCYGPGTYWYNSWSADLYDFSTRVETVNIWMRGEKTGDGSQDFGSAGTKDQQEVKMRVAVSFQVDADKCHSTFRQHGTNYVAAWVIPQTVESAKAGTSDYSAEELIQQRAAVKAKIENILKDRLAFAGITSRGVALTDMDFDAKYMAAVVAKQVELQKVAAEKHITAQRKEQGEQRVALAEGERQANEKLKLTLTPELLEFLRVQNQKEAIAKWNGQPPSTIVGTGAGMVPFMEVGKR